LETNAQLTEQEVERIFGDLSGSLQNEAAVQIFLTCCPESKQGLFLIASALLHPSMTLRFYACLILQRLEAFPSTRPAVQSLNRLLLLAYRRVLKEMTAGVG
jgi:hypothetical protein